MTRTEVLIRSGDVTRVLTGSFVFFLAPIVLVEFGSSEELSSPFRGFICSVLCGISNVSLLSRLPHEFSYLSYF